MQHDPQNVALYGNIRNSISQARLWATTGHKSGRFIELKQISYRCEEELLHKCTDSDFGVGAYTASPQRTGKGWQVTFCPTFFRRRYANDILKAGRTSQVNKLVSYEHLMAHEYMHVAMLGHCENIIDVNTTLLPSTDGAYGTVYGASRCKEWAWLNVPAGDEPSSYDTKASINREVVMNADNYAWYATSAYFSYNWGKSSGAKAKRQLFDDSTQPDYATFTVDPESGNDINNGATYDDEIDAGDADVIVGAGENPNLTWPQNCHPPNDTNPDGELLCDYIGEQYTDLKADTPPVGDAPTDLPNINATSTEPPAASTSAAPAPPSYATGWCGMHVVQYQKNEDGDPAHPSNPEYVIDVSLFDANQQPIPLKNCNGCQNTTSSVALNGQADDFQSALPFAMEVTCGAVDDDPINFKYGDQTWGSNDQAHHSNFGAYDSGKREGNTGFQC